MGEFVLVPKEPTEAMSVAGRKELARIADRMEEAKLLARSSIDFWQRVGHHPADDIFAAMLSAAPPPEPVVLETVPLAVYRDNMQSAWAALAMVREAVEEFGPAASLEGPDAVLLRGPEPVHEAEALVAALTRLLSQADAARQAERDRCAKIAEGHVGPTNQTRAQTCADIAALIRSDHLPATPTEGT